MKNPMVYGISPAPVVAMCAYTGECFDMEGVTCDECRIAYMEQRMEWAEHDKDR